MNSIMVADLQAGMIFDKAVYVEGNNILVPPGIPLKQKDIERLKNWDIVEVFSDSEPRQEPKQEPEPAGVEYQEDAVDFSFYYTAVNELEDVFQNIEQDFVSGEDRRRLDIIAGDILLHCHENGGALVRKIFSTQLDQKNMAISALNCAILSTIIAMTIIKQKSLLLDLIKAALLHDTGMLRVSESILSKQEKLTMGDITEIRAHTRNSFNIIKKMGYSGRIGVIVLSHHEKWNGSGYPARMKGEEIPLEARIIAVADTYVALVNSRPYRDYYLGYNAMKAILSDNGTHFDPEIIKIFLKTIGIYPIGSIVRLSDQSIGKITDINSRAPLRPRIAIIRDSRGRKRQMVEIIDLMEKQDLFITKALDPKALEKLENG